MTTVFFMNDDASKSVLFAITSVAKYSMMVSLHTPAHQVFFRLSGKKFGQPLKVPGFGSFGLSLLSRLRTSPGRRCEAVGVFA
jgi:hypothetical protein